MHGIPSSEIRLQLTADIALLPVVTSYTEKGSAALGLAEQDALSLTLATEEIFAYLCCADPGLDVTLCCRGGGYYVEQEFLFRSLGFNLGAFNLTAKASFDECRASEETGLLIASRMVDGFRVSREDGELRLVLVKEKSYPEVSESSVPEAKTLTRFTIRRPDPEEIKILVRMVNKYYSRPFVPASFGSPGKVVDMEACGEYVAAIAVDDAGHIGGGAVWRWSGKRLVEIYGPYVFGPQPGTDMGHALVDRCIHTIARTKAVGLVSRRPTPEFPTDYCEPLGTLTHRTGDGSHMEITRYYRHLEEDSGSKVWAHPSIEPFLAGEYDRLAFAREIRLVTREGEKSSPNCVLFADFDRGLGRVTLRPIWWGEDADTVLPAYLEILLADEGVDVVFPMDLGQPWQCHFTPGLLACGFKPTFVLPQAETGDLLIFHHEARGTCS